MNKYLKLLLVINILAIGFYGSAIFVYSIPLPMEDLNPNSVELTTNEKFYDYKKRGFRAAKEADSEIILLLSLVIFINSVTLIYVIKNNSKQNT